MRVIGYIEEAKVVSTGALGHCCTRRAVLHEWRELRQDEWLITVMGVRPQ